MTDNQTGYPDRHLTDDLIIAQMELEQSMTDDGVHRYRSRLEKRKEGSLEAETAYGSSLLSNLTDIVAKALVEFIAQCETGRAGRKHSAYKYLKNCDPHQASYLALRAVLQSISNVKRLQTVAHSIGKALEDEVRFENVRSEDRNFYRHLKGEAQRRDDQRNKRATVIYYLNRFMEEWEGWPAKDLMLIGTKMIELIIEHTGLVEIRHDSTARNQTMVRLAPTEETLKWIDRRNSAAELLDPIYAPMLVPPRDWTTPFDGGYLTRTVKPIRMVKTRSRGYLDELANTDMPVVYSAINGAQRTAWKVNQPILDLLSSLWDNGSTLGTIPSRYHEEVPAKPHDIDDNEEARKIWRKQAAAVHRNNREQLSKRTQFAFAVTTAERFKDYDAIFFPYQMDFRGRLYAVPHFNPQGPDFMKALLHFSEGKELTEEAAPFLAIHLANCGAFNKIDKAPLEDRVQWVYDNEENILASADNPYDHRWWTEADSPFQFLAACMEWAAYIRASGAGEIFLSRLAVGLDGSCSGIQHFSLALRDAVGGAAVNLTKADKPADIYTLVMDKAYEQMNLDAADPEKGEIARQWLQFAPGRSCFKRPTMTYGYGSRAYGFRDQIMTDTLSPAYRAFKKGEGSWPFEADGFAASVYLANVVAAAVDRVVVKAAEAMEWLKGAAKVVSAEGLPVKWTTPDGFPVLQAYRELKSRRIETLINGSTILKLSLSEELPQVDKRSQAQGISPNFVHSLDGTHLRLTVARSLEEGITDFALVHDSFGVHAADTPRFFQIIREALVEMYDVVDVIGEFRAEIESQIDEGNRDKLKQPPSSGGLDLNEVLESAFCFA